LISCNLNEADIPSDAFALYSQEAGWTTFAENFGLRNTNAVAFANRKNQIALVDSKNQVRLFLTENGSQITSFPLQLPSRSVLFLDFILEDSCLLVKTKDAQILIYDLSTGQIVFHDKMGSTYTGTLLTYTDSNNQRLYIIDSNISSRPNCLCVDLRSWTTLGTGSNVLCYDEVSGELIHFNSSYDSQNSLSCLKIPSTQELVVLGRQMLSAG
jgi:WD40 repeat protein